MVGRSLRQIVWARLRRDKVAMFCLVVLVFLYASPSSGRSSRTQLGIDPIKLDSDRSATSAAGRSGLGGISPDHIFGVEWGTGRDIFAQLLFGLRISLSSRPAPRSMTVVLGTVVGIIAGYTGGLTRHDHRPADGPDPRLPVPPDHPRPVRRAHAAPHRPRRAGGQPVADPVPDPRA